MSKPRASKSKRSISSIIGFGIIVLGVGCTCLATIKIMSASIPIIYNDSSSSSIATTIDVKPVELTTDNIAPTKTDDASSILGTEKNLYLVYPMEGDIIGSLSIPALKMERPVVQGTSVDELEQGVGHFLQSVLPGENDNCVLSGHRDTVFVKLGELKIGDQLIVQTSAGTFTYEVSGTRIVDKDDKTVIVPTDHAVLTVTTCYPFKYVGPAPNRYIVSADLVTNK